jgi:hypothetical protein
MVAERRHADPAARHRDGRTAPRALLVVTGAAVGDAGASQVHQRVDESDRVEVGHVVVGKAGNGRADRLQRARRRRRRAEEVGLAGHERGRPSAGGDAALEVADDRIAAAQQLPQLRRPQVLGRRLREPLAHAPAEHDVAEQRDPGHSRGDSG